jgi:hypothetical protein
MPYRGIWQHTKKMNSVIEVHKTFSRKGIFLSGGDTSGRMDIKGRTRWRTRMVVRSRKGRHNTK